MTPSGSVQTFVVAAADRSTRLDQFLVRHWAGCSRRLARQAIAAGAVAVNGRPARKGQMLSPGDVVRADPSLLGGMPAPQPDLVLPVLYIDDAIVAVDKPAGMPAVALRAGDRDTVANYLLARFPELSASGRTGFEAGLVHRLDTPTSGVLVAARSRAAWQHLRAQFRTRSVDKLYLAVVAGSVRRGGRIDLPIAHQPRRPRRMMVCADTRQANLLRARPAVTRYRPLRQLKTATLLAVSIPTGARHQIRVHLASLGHPILGDAQYSAAADEAGSRLLLHAARIAFAHPQDGRRVIIRSRAPTDFESALDALRS